MENGSIGPPLRFYRYETDLFILFGDDIPQVRNKLRMFDLLRETPKGYWIVPERANSERYREKYKRWIPKESKKRFAYPTKSEAYHGYIKRMDRYIHILKSRLNNAQTALLIAKGDKEKLCQD